MREYYCPLCLQRKEAKYFSIWMEDKTKARRCNSCHKPEVERRHGETWANGRKKPTAAENKHKREVRDRIYDLKARQQIIDDHAL